MKQKIGFAMCGSFCTLKEGMGVMQELADAGYDLYPIMSGITYSTDTRFGKASDFVEQAERLCGKKVMHTIPEVEPIGPKGYLDLLLVAPCTGNTIGKLAGGITDSSVTMAVKAQLRNGKPVVLAVATNDALSASAKNIGLLMNQRNVYFVPMVQDDPVKKPTSMIAEFSKVKETIERVLGSR